MTGVQTCALPISKKITIYLKKKDHTIDAIEGVINRSSSAINDFSGIASDLFLLIFKKKHFYRATGVVLQKLVERGVDDRTLFDDPIKIVKYKKVSETIDSINQKHGSSTIHMGSSLCLDKSRHNATSKKFLNIPILKN